MAELTQSVNALHAMIDTITSSTNDKLTEFKGMMKTGTNTAISPSKRSIMSPVRISRPINPDHGIFLITFGEASDFVTVKTPGIVYETKSVIMIGMTKEYSQLKEQLSIFNVETCLFVNVLDTMLNNSYIQVCDLFKEPRSSHNIKLMKNNVSIFYNIPVTKTEQPLKINILNFLEHPDYKVFIVKTSDISFISKKLKNIL
jgi:hypothetical protein